ncbi:MAG: AMP-dependent synthetase/ligase [Solirubrobacteraceae bacterium]
MLLGACDRYDGVALRWLDDGRWRELSYREVGTAAREIAGGLVDLGLGPGDPVAILSTTRPEWTLADAGALSSGAVVVPVYHTNSPEECGYVLGHSEARAIFCEDPEQLAKVEQVRSDLPHLEHVILLRGEAPGALTLDQLRARGAGRTADVDARLAGPAPEDVATLVYTSGTTGPPKGCMLTHANWVSTVDMYVDRLQLDGGAFFMFLPLAHVMARINQMFAIEVGATLVFWQGDMATVLDDLKAAGPTHFASVPRMFEKIFTAASAGIAEQSWLKRAVFNWALATGRAVRERERRGQTPGPVLRRRYALAERLVLSKIQALFGGRLEFAFTAAAPIAADVLEFFDAAGIRILEAYGMTESTAAGTINTLDEWRIGSVGRPLPPCELSIADDGEILMRGPHVLRGYHKNPQATQETTVDGWLRTGDLGAIDDDGYVSITGRKKDIIITSSGKNVTPANIENALRESRWISEVVLCGDRRPYLVALIWLDPDEAPKLAEEVGADPAHVADDERARQAIQREVDKVNERFAHVEAIRRFRIVDRELTQAGGELTPTMKVKRQVVHREFADEIAALYEA